MSSLKTLTMQAIDRNWIQLSKSRRTHMELQEMISSNGLLADHTSKNIIYLVSNTKGINRERRDPVLAGLFDFVDESELASSLILQSLRAQIACLVRTTYFADPEERASAIFSIATERIMKWRPKTPDFCHYNLYVSILRKTLTLARKWRNWESAEPISNYAEGDAISLESLEYLSEDECLSKGQVKWLIDWVADIGGVDQETAQMVVLTRTGFSTINHHSEMAGLSPQTLRQRRLRAENNFRRILKAGN